MNDNFKAINKYLGWGDPKKGGIWFVGLEEKLGWKFTDEGQLIAKHQKTLSKYLDEYKDASNIWDKVHPGEIKAAKDEFGQCYTKIDEIISKLATHLGWKDHCEKFMTEILYQAGSGVFRINLFPLGKHSVKTWPKDYGKFFGFKDLGEYLRKIETRQDEWPDLEPRFERIYDLWEKHKPDVTVCFGKWCWNDFKNIFKLSEPSRIDGATEDDKIKVFKDKRVILTPFFRYGKHAMTNKRIETLAKIISDFGFTFPKQLQTE